MSESAENICVACKNPMLVIPEGLWMFRNGPFSLIVRLITKTDKGQVESHQICLPCIKSIVEKLQPPETAEPTNATCLPR